MVNSVPGRVSTIVQHDLNVLYCSLNCVCKIKPLCVVVLHYNIFILISSDTVTELKCDDTEKKSIRRRDSAHTRAMRKLTTPILMITVLFNISVYCYTFISLRRNSKNVVVCLIRLVEKVDSFYSRLANVHYKFVSKLPPPP